MKQFKIKRLLTYLFLVLGLLIITHVILRVSLFQSYNTKVDFTMSDENNVVIKLNKPNPFDSAVEKKNKRNIQDDEAFKLANSFCKKNYTYSFMGKADASLPSFVDGDEFRGKGNHIYDSAGGLLIYIWKFRFICANNLDEALFAYYKKKPESYSSLIQGVPVSYYNSSTISQSLISSDVRKKFAKYTTTDPLLEKKKVAKKEPTQTQQVAKKKKRDEARLAQKKKLEKERLAKKEKKKEKKKVAKEEKKTIKKLVAKIDKPVKKFVIPTKKSSKKTTDIVEVQGKVSKCDKYKDKFAKKICKQFSKNKKTITMEEAVALGSYQEFDSYPEDMLKEFGNCKKQFCRGKKAGKKMYEIFVKRGEQWHQRYPGDMIYGMAWFEIVYFEKLRKNNTILERYIKYAPDNYPKHLGPWLLQNDINAIHSLINMNKGRVKMRTALGLSEDDDLAKVLSRHFLLGDFLNNDKYKVKKVKLNSGVKKRKELIIKYQSAIKKYKEKLTDEKGL